MTSILSPRFAPLLLCCWLLLTAPAPAAGGEVKVVTGIAPLSYLVEEIGGDLVRTGTLIPSGQDPHTFEPRPGQISELSRADLYFSLDMPFERILLAKLPRREDAGPRIIDVSEGIDKLPMPEHHHDHDHGHGHDHNHIDNADKGHHHGEADPHIWLGPPQLLTIIEHIRQGLSTADPDNAEVYRENHDRLQRAIKDLHARNRELLAPLAGQTFFVYHPAFGYFTEAYELRQKPVEIAGKSPAPRQLIKLIEMARQEGVRVIFVQPQFDQSSAKAVARAIDGAVVALDPLAADVLANLEHMATKIRDGLKNNREQ